jgi:hypothetical protein
LVTVVLGGSAAFMSGRAVAQTWRPYWHIPVYMVPIAATVRFFHYALFGEPLVSLQNYLVDYGVALIAASLGFRLLRARQMAQQYHWLFSRNGLLHWRKVS